MRNLASSIQYAALSLGVVSLLFLAACSNPNTPEGRVKIALKAEGRPAADKKLDSVRHPAKMVKFMGIEEGMTILDAGSSRGYNVDIFSAAVGETGKVYAQNNQRMLTFRDGVVDKAMTERLANDRLPNVVRLDREFEDLGLRREVDIVYWGLNLHDYYNTQGGELKTLRILSALRRAIKRGGLLVVSDNVGVAGKDNTKLHRIEPELAKELIEKVGFKIEEESDLLANPKDDHSLFVFNEKLKRNGDRFLLKARKIIFQ